jgi:hypothetical protein
MARIGLSRTAGGGVVRGAAGEGLNVAAPWIVRLARAGYAAKGVLHLVIGGLAVLAATGSRGSTTDSRGALNVVHGTTGGQYMLLAMGAGLLGYALWAVLAAVLDAEHRGSEAKGVLQRIGLGARAFIYGALGIEAIRLFITAQRSNGNGAAHWTARVLEWPAGPWLVGAAGAAVIGYAGYQFWRAARKDLRKRMHLAEAGPAASRWIIRVARFGIAARGVVFIIIGWFLIRAAVRHDAQQVGGIAESLRTLAQQPYGPVLLGIVASGVAAYGVWQLVRARYREMPVQ